MIADRRVVTYIKQELDRGVSKEKIVDALLGVGHHHTHVKNAFSELGHDITDSSNIQNHTMPSPDNNSSKHDVSHRNESSYLSRAKQNAYESAVLTKGLKERDTQDTWFAFLLLVAIITAVVLGVYYLSTIGGA